MDKQERYIRLISFIGGVVFLFLFAFVNPGVFSPQITLLVAGLIFGPSVISVFKDGGKREQ